MDSGSRRDALLAAYEVIGARRGHYDTMAWQTPVVSFTAQAFLLTVALSADTSVLARVLAAGLSCVVAVLAIQLLQKHQHMELIDSIILERIEVDLGIVEALGMKPHTTAAERRRKLQLSSGAELRGGFVVDRHSPRWWTAGMLLFGLVSVVIVVLSLVDDSVLR